MLYFRTLWAALFNRDNLPKQPYVVTTQGKIFKFVSINSYDQNITVEKGYFFKSQWYTKGTLELSPNSIEKYISESSARKYYIRGLKRKNQDLMNQTLDLD